jgi:antitoxin MazE
MHDKTHPLPPDPHAREGDFVKLVADTYEQLVFQDARVFKAGNSLAIRIPSAIAKTIDLEDGSPIEMAVGNGVLWVRKGTTLKLSGLIDQISPENTHGEQFSDLVGKERW